MSSSSAGSDNSNSSNSNNSISSTGDTGDAGDAARRAPGVRGRSNMYERTDMLRDRMTVEPRLVEELELLHIHDGTGRMRYLTIIIFRELLNDELRNVYCPPGTTYKSSTVRDKLLRDYREIQLSDRLHRATVVQQQSRREAVASSVNNINRNNQENFPLQQRIAATNVLSAQQRQELQQQPQQQTQQQQQPPNASSSSRTTSAVASNNSNDLNMMDLQQDFQRNMQALVAQWPQQQRFPAEIVGELSSSMSSLSSLAEDDTVTLQQSQRELQRVNDAMRALLQAWGDDGAVLGGGGERTTRDNDEANAKDLGREDEDDGIVRDIDNNNNNNSENDDGHSARGGVEDGSTSAGSSPPSASVSVESAAPIVSNDGSIIHNHTITINVGPVGVDADVQERIAETVFRTMVNTQQRHHQYPATEDNNHHGDEDAVAPDSQVDNDDGCSASRNAEDGDDKGLKRNNTDVNDVIAMLTNGTRENETGRKKTKHELSRQSKRV